MVPQNGRRCDRYLFPMPQSDQTAGWPGQLVVLAANQQEAAQSTSLLSGSHDIFWCLLSLRDPDNGLRLSGNWGTNPGRGGTLLATRVSGWDANSFFALKPPNGGDTPWMQEVPPPFGGFRHPRETDIHGLTPRG
jgi:hypothetical protein